MVDRFEHNSSPDGRKAWIELECVYCGRAQGERPVQLLSLEARPRNLHSTVAESTTFVVQLGRIRVELESLGALNSDAAKEAALLKGFKNALPYIYSAHHSTRGD